MALAKETVEDLRRELDRLRSEASAIERIIAIQEGRLSLELPFARGPIARTVLPPPPRSPSFPAKGMSFRDAIRFAVKSAGAPVMPGDVEVILANAGYVDSGEAATPLRTRIGTELAKLSQIQGSGIAKGEHGYMPATQ